MKQHSGERTGIGRRRIIASSYYCVAAPLITFSVCLGAFGQQIPSAAAPPPPNVLLIVVDTLRADRIEATRDSRAVMPHLRTFAHQSLAFSRAYSSEAWTLPSTISIHTSLYPEVHGVMHSQWTRSSTTLVCDTLPEGVETLAQRLKKAGYRTVAIQTNPHLQEQSGLARGFDIYEYRFAALAEDVTTAALEAVGSSPQPLFLYVHYFDPHCPYLYHPEFARQLGDVPPLSEADTNIMRNYMGYYEKKFRVPPGSPTERQFGDLSAAGRQHVRYLYDSEAAYVDLHIGQLMERLTSAGRLDARSVVVVTADHGEQLWEHGSIGHNRTVYEEVIHVPLLMNVPDVTPAFNDKPVSTLDIAPTLMHAIGLSPNDQWQGHDLLATVSGQTGPRPIVARARGSQAIYGINLDVVILGTDKLLHKGTTGETAVYDLVTDPGEQTPVLSSQSDVRARLEAALAAHESACAAHPTRALPRIKLDYPGETTEQIRSLGYIQ